MRISNQITRALNNTEDRILCILKHPRAPMDVVDIMWPRSKQPQKKLRTIQHYLKLLKRRGLAHTANGLWWAPDRDGPRGGGRKVRLAA